MNKASPLVLNCYSSCGMWTDETKMFSSRGLRNGEGLRGAPANFKI